MLLTRTATLRDWPVGGLFLLASLAHLGCGGSDPISAKTSKFEVADDSDVSLAEESETDPAENEPAPTASKEPPRASKPPIDQESKRETAAGKQAPKDEQTGLYQAPKGAPSVQMEFIERLAKQPLRGNSQKSQMVDYEDRTNAIVAACNNILQHKDATDDEKRAAITTKFLELSKMSAALEKSEYSKQAMDFAAELQSKEKGSVEKELGVAIGASLLPEQFARLQKPSDADVKKLVDGYLSYLAEGPLPPLHEPGLGTIQLLYSFDRRNEAVKVAEAMMAAFSAAKDLPAQEVMLSDIETLLRSAKLDFTRKLIAASQDDKAFDEFASTLEEFLKDRKIDRKLLESVYQSASVLERSGRVESAEKVFDRLSKLAETTEDKDAVKQLRSLLEAAAARKSLLGSPFDFAAMDAEGKEFKLSSLKGKRALVLFWSARDQGSMQELGNIEQTLQTAKDAFEVVVVNIDDDPKLFERFSANQKIPFAIASLVCPESEKPGPASALEKQIGLNQVPFSILVDAEGKVEAFFAQGPRLGVLATAAEEGNAGAAEEPKNKPAAEEASKNEAAKTIEDEPKKP